MNRLQQLHDAGVSIWLDALSRELLDSGAFAALIADSAVTGAISNPTVFAEAIRGSDAYDDQIRAAVASGVRDTQELFFAIALDDVRHAADLLRPAHDASDGRDGFISFECTRPGSTMPEATLCAFADHGEATRVLSESTATADEVLRDAERAGVELAAVTAQLEREGVESFCASYHELVERIETKTEGGVMATERPDAVR
jgi:transaldolase